MNVASRLPVVLASSLLVLLSAAAPATAGEPLALSVREAVLLGLEHNRALDLERAGPQMARAAEEAATAPFDTTLSAGASAAWERSPSSPGGDLENDDRQRLSVGASRLLPTGTTLELGADISGSGPPDSAATRYGASATQALLRGRGAAAVRAAVRQARIDTALSEHELSGVAIALAAQIEQGCWDVLLAGRRLEIVERSLALAEDQLDEVRERIAVGRLAAIEQTAAEAEVALRREALINARSALAAGRLRLLRLVNPPGEDPLGREVTITDEPALPGEGLAAVADHVALGLRMRPDLSQARLRLERGELELVKTRDGLLPRLDVFVALGATGYASSIGGSVDPTGDGREIEAGFTFSVPLGNRAARAADERARIDRERAAGAVGNLAQLVEVDVRGAWIEAARQREQVAATAATLRLQEEKLRAETEKFRVGRSTAWLVAQAQRDVLQAETEAVGAVVGTLRALAELHRLEGSLLARLGIVVSGAAPTPPPPGDAP